MVTNAEDPQNLGRVKVKYPWMSNDAEGDWTRVIGAGAGNETGFIAVPDVGDEVLVAFINGNFDQPVVLGGLWNGQDKIPPETAGASSNERPKVREWRSRTGHRVVQYDNSEKKIEIVSAGGLSVTLNDQDKNVVIKSAQVNLTLEDNKLTVESSTEVDIKAQTNIKIEASGNVDIKAGGQVNIKGSVVNLN